MTDRNLAVSGAHRSAPGAPEDCTLTSPPETGSCDLSSSCHWQLSHSCDTQDSRSDSAICLLPTGRRFRSQYWRRSPAFLAAHRRSAIVIARIGPLVLRLILRVFVPLLNVLGKSEQHHPHDRRDRFGSRLRLHHPAGPGALPSLRLVADRRRLWTLN
jgi:hypothetical protein